MTLAQLNERYEAIMREQDDNKRDKQLAVLMTEMERQYKIPMQRSEAWEEQNRTVIALYRKISLSRTL
jgi:hypothetical protein